MDGLRMNLEFTDYHPDTVTLFFKRFDRGLGHIGFQSFGDAILPFTQEFANMVTDRPDCYIRKGCDPKQYFTCDTRRHF